MPERLHGERETMTEINDIVDEAYQRGAIEGYRRGREDAANAVHDMAMRDESRYVRTDWLTYEDGQRERPDRWLSATHVIGVARGDL
jgi:hypothetical protein